MDLRHLTTLMAVAEHGSFSAAARATHTVQSNVSTHIARLEREVGSQLVDRPTGDLTEEGLVVLARARRVQQELDGLTSDIAALRDELVGEVRLGVIGSVARWLVPALLELLADEHPNVTIVVVDASTTSLVPQLLDASLEMCVLNLPVVDRELESEMLFEEDRILVVPGDHPLATEETITLSVLADHPLVLEPSGTAFRDELDAAAEAHGVELAPMAQVDGMMLVASLAVRGFGPAILPESAIRAFPVDGTWIRRPISDLPPRAVGLVRRRPGRLGAPARAVWRHIPQLVSDAAESQPGLRLYDPRR